MLNSVKLDKQRGSGKCREHTFLGLCSLAGVVSKTKVDKGWEELSVVGLVAFCTLVS